MMMTNNEKAEILETVGFQSQSPEQPWETPEPFETVDLPDFPLDCLPPAVAEYMKALTESTQTTSEMCGLLALGVLATTVQRLYEIQIKDDWISVLGLYTVAVAPPAERKSPVIAAISAPLRKYEDKVATEMAEDLAVATATKEAMTAKLEQMKKHYAQGKLSMSAVHEVARAVEAIEVPSAVRLLVDDTTPEKLAVIMEQQNGKLCISSSEGGIFDSMGGRYESKSANIDIYLKGIDGELITVDRITRKAVRISRPTLSMVLTVQPSVLRGILTNVTFRGRGLCGRFLYAVCKSKVGYRHVDSLAVPARLEHNYEVTLTDMLSRRNGGLIKMDKEARELYLQFAREIEEQLRIGGQYEGMGDWGGKIVGYVIRIAAILHAYDVEDPVGYPMSREAMERAIRIGACLQSHGIAAYQQMGADKDGTDAEYVWCRIQDNGKKTISKRELHRLCKGRLPKTADLEPALQRLATMNYIREKTVSTGGRPSVQIEVNPKA